MTAPTCISFNVWGRPTPKGRPVFGRGFVRTPHKTVVAEGLIHAAALDAIKTLGGGDQPPRWDGPVAVDCTFFFSIPPSWPKPRRESSREAPHTSRPDLDNLAKAVLDGVGTLFWNDDAQVCQVTTRKRYTDSGERTEITIQRCPV